MGIPVFFKTLITDYQHVIEPVTNQPIDNLFFDLNCLIHPSCAKVKDGNEDEMIHTIITDIDKLIKLTGAWTELIFERDRFIFKIWGRFS